MCFHFFRRSKNQPQPLHQSLNQTYSGQIEESLHRENKPTPDHGGDFDPNHHSKTEEPFPDHGGNFDPNTRQDPFAPEAYSAHGGDFDPNQPGTDSPSDPSDITWQDQMSTSSRNVGTKAPNQRPTSDTVILIPLRISIIGILTCSLNRCICSPVPPYKENRPQPTSQCMLRV